jgi:small-conductance mechanosensitive channel
MRIPHFGPFSQNYVRDWLIYHGVLFLIGVLAFYFAWPLDHLFAALFGGGIMGAAVGAGIINYLMDIC